MHSTGTWPGLTLADFAREAKAYPGFCPEGVHKVTPQLPTARDERPHRAPCSENGEESLLVSALSAAEACKQLRTV